MATERNNATVVTGRVGEVAVEIMLDTGSTVSLLRRKEADSMNTHQDVPQFSWSLPQGSRYLLSVVSKHLYR